MYQKVQNSSLFYQNYQIQSQIGRGASGVCYKIKKINDNKIFALKKIGSTSIKRNNIKAAYNEVTILSSLQHPNIIKYYESFMDEQELYIVMQYASKGDLHSILKKRKIKQHFFSENQLWLMIHQLLNALQYLHNKNIIHRDVKTLNIFVDQNNNLIIGDLGVSKIIKSDLGLYSRVGTPLYLPPEIIKYQKYDFKADVWGLGCVSYLLATLSHPFQGKNIITLGQNIVSTEPKPIQKYSQNINKLIFDMLQKDHTKRLTPSMLLKKYYSEGQKKTCSLKFILNKRIEEENITQQLIKQRKQVIQKQQQNKKESYKIFQRRYFTTKKSQQAQKEEEKDQINKAEIKNAKHLRYQKKLTYLIGNFVKQEQIVKKNNVSILVPNETKIFQDTIEIKPKKSFQSEQLQFGNGNQQLTKCQKQSNNIGKKEFQSQHNIVMNDLLKQHQKQFPQNKLQVYHHLRQKHSFSKIIANNCIKNSASKLPSFEKLTPTNKQVKKLIQKIKLKNYPNNINFSKIKSNIFVKSVQNFQPLLIVQDQSQYIKVHPSQMKKIPTQAKSTTNNFQMFRNEKQNSAMQFGSMQNKIMMRKSHDSHIYQREFELKSRDSFIDIIKAQQQRQSNNSIRRYRQRPKSSIGKKQKYYQSSSIKPQKKQTLYKNMYSMVQTKILKKPEVIIL